MRSKTLRLLALPSAAVVAATVPLHLSQKSNAPTTQNQPAPAPPRSNGTLANLKNDVQWSDLTQAIGGTVYKHFDCANNLTHAADDLLDAIKSLKNPGHNHEKRAEILARQAALPSTVTVPAVFHIVLSSASAGAVNSTQPQLQLDAMNAMYASSGIQFTLANVTTTINDAWAVGADEDMAAMKSALRQGGYSTLNIYFQSDLAGGILGTCSMPSTTTTTATTAGAAGGGGGADGGAYAADGCSVNAGTMPGGSIYGYNAGMTAAHETGHWLGLFHTFEGRACGGDGDFIDDTPAQSVATNGCPTAAPAQDSCPDSPGVDAVHNVMDYSDDGCYTGFSPEQVHRMKAMWAQFREGK